MKKLYKEQTTRSPDAKKNKMSINVIDSPRRKYSVFIGASIIGNYYNYPDTKDYWVSIDEWLECGDNAVSKENVIKNLRNVCNFINHLRIHLPSILCNCDSYNTAK